MRNLKDFKRQKKRPCRSSISVREEHVQRGGYPFKKQRTVRKKKIMPKEKNANESLTFDQEEPKIDAMLILTLFSRILGGLTRKTVNTVRFLIINLRIYT